MTEPFHLRVNTVEGEHSPVVWRFAMAIAEVDDPQVRLQRQCHPAASPADRSIARDFAGLYRGSGPCCREAMMPGKSGLGRTLVPDWADRGRATRHGGVAGPPRRRQAEGWK